MKQLPEQLLNALGFIADFELAPLPGNENKNYLVKTSEQSFVVKKLQGHSAANTELEGIYRNYIADAGLPATPYAKLNGRSCVLTLGKDNYVATPFIKGKMITSNRQVLAEGGALLAKVHSLDASSMPARKSWYRKSYLPESIGLINDEYADAKKTFVARYDAAPDFWNGVLPTGIIHGDLQKDNIIMNDQDRVASLLDWEETAVEPLLLDVAHSAQQLSFEH